MKNETIQVDGKFYNKSKVVMLPTEKALKVNSLYLIDNNLNFCKDIMNDLLRYGDKIKPQHLYFLSEEEIKEGDWQYDSHYKRIEQYFHGKATGMSIYKIIATTDESLKTTIVRHNDFDSEYSLPRPSNEFLQAYCKANGKIGEVLIECEANFTPDVDTSKVCGRDNWRLKVSSDNTVTIKKLERKLYLMQQEIDKRINMHDELVNGLKELREQVATILSKGKNYKPTWDEYDALREKETKAEQLLNQSEAK